MSTIIIITPPPRPLSAQSAEERMEQLKKDAQALEAAGFSVTVVDPPAKE